MKILILYIVDIIKCQKYIFYVDINYQKYKQEIFKFDRLKFEVVNYLGFDISGVMFWNLFRYENGYEF